MTDDEKQEILNAIKAESQSVDELEEVTSLDNVKSLPAMQGEKVVSAPLTLLAKPAEDAAAVAKAAAESATAAAATATAAAESANTAAEKAAAAVTEAENATEKANDAANQATTAAENY